MRGLIFLFLFQNAYALNFREAVQEIRGHKEIRALSFKVQALQEKAHKDSSWGDPMFRVAAKNYPVDTLKDDQTPMTGIEFGVSQKISLTNKSSNIKESINAMADSIEFDKQDHKRLLVKYLWNQAILKDQLLKDIKIIEDNLAWTNKMVSISKKHYSNGRISQQSLLDIQIRKSELESQLEVKRFEIKEIDTRISFLVEKPKSVLNIKSVPWKTLSDRSLNPNDPKEKSFKKMVAAKDLGVRAQKKNFVPDLNVSFGYTKRSNIDNKGDFVGAMISFPLPFSGVKYASHKEAVFEKEQAIRNLDNYLNKKQNMLDEIFYSQNKIEKELEILSQRTLVFARNSRDISAKSYKVGKTSYLELLNSELKLQNLEMKRNGLEAKLRMNKLERKYITGENLDD